MNATGLLWRVARSSRCCPIYASYGGEGRQGGEHAEKPLGNRSKKDTGPGPRSGQSSLPKGDPARSQSSPEADSTPQQPPPPPLARPAAKDQPPPEVSKRTTPGGCARLQQLSEGNSPNGAAPDCFLANMHPPPKTAPQSGERRARRRPASEQGPDLAQLQHPPLLLSERGRGTSDAGGEQGRARRARGGSRRECAAPGPAAPPSAASVAPPARLHGRRGLLGLPRGSPGSARAPEPPRPPLRSAACRRGGEPGPPWRPAPSAPELRPARGPRHLCRRRRRERGSSRRAQQLSPRLSPGGRLRRLASERASAPPPPKAAPGAEHAQCRRQSAALRHANSTSGFRGGNHSSREGRRRRSRLGEGRASSGAPGTRARTGVETLAGQMPVCKRVKMEGF